MPSKGKFRARVGNMAPLKIPEAQQPQPATPDIDLPDVATITIGDQTFSCSVDDLDDEGELGRGAYGSVSRMRHRTTKTIMAVKRIRATLNQSDNKRLLMDYNVSMRCVDCPYTITFYGALFREGDVWICMELMDCSLDKLYQIVFNVIKERIPELVLGKIAESTLKALRYLHDELKVMHRDVKPSNILINRKGEIKLCDFGIAGELVNSLAKTDIGCRPYLAPERIYQEGGPTKYDHRSDVWSYGITLHELAMGRFPYPPYRNLFEQMKLVIEGPPPRLPDDQFSEAFRDYIHLCLTKEKDQRPKYEHLIKHEFILKMEREKFDVAEWYHHVEEKEAAIKQQQGAPEVEGAALP